jgi:adenylosuccinate lyase
MPQELDLVGKLDEESLRQKRFSLRCVSPDDSKYAGASAKLIDYLSAEAEWYACAFVQLKLIETRAEFGQAEQRNVDEVKLAIDKIDPLNISLLESEITKHDQLAVLEELGRHVSEETKALLHPGTTSYDILDTARSYLFRKAWSSVMRPEMSKSIWQLCDLAEKSGEILQVGRTHLQDTSPVPLKTTFALYAARLAERINRCDCYFNDLRGKISGIIGTGASIDMVIGEDSILGGKSLNFEEEVLKKLGLESDHTATQIVQKERLTDVGHGLTTLMHVLGDFTNDIRILYSSAIGEVTSRDNAQRLGGSSADATKNNPINYENICGKVTIVESGMRILYEMIHSDLQRDLRGSVMARYQPQSMMAETYESFLRLNKALPNLSFNEDRLLQNMQPVKDNPSEAMVAILRGEKWIHPEYGVGHDFVKMIGRKAKSTGKKLMAVALADESFRDLYNSLPESKQKILNGELELYIGSSLEKADINIQYARQVANGG